MTRWLLLFLCFRASAQIVINGGVLNGSVLGTTNLANGGGGGAYVLLGHTNTTGTGGGDQTTGQFDSTGAKLIKVGFARFRQTSATTNKIVANTGDTFVPSIMFTNVFGRNFLQTWECRNPTASTTYTITGSDGSDFVALTVAWFSGGTTGFDTETGNTNDWVSNTIKSGTNTPTGDTELLTSFASGGAAVGITNVDSGFTIIEQGTSDGSLIRMAYTNQAIAAPVNPTWKGTGGNNGAAVTSADK